MRTVGVRLMADISQYTSRMRDAGKTTRDFAGELDKAAKAGRLDAVTDQAAMLGAGLVGVVGIAGKFAADFEKQMSHVAAATHASGKEMEQLRQAALRAGQDTQFSATEAAKGIEELSKAGVSSSAILGGALDGALDLAAAGSLDVGEAAETAASAMTQFKLKGADVPHIADLLSAAAGKAQGSVHDMGMALNQAGLVAAQTGLSIEETTGGLAAFASAGLTGSDAGTSFKQMLLMIQAPSDKTRGLMEDLGISLYDASGNVKGLAQFAGELREKMSTLTPEVRANAMAQIFGADAVRGASILYEQGQAGIQGWIDKTNDAGYAAETAEKKTDNLIGDLERLKGSLETLAIESASGANGGLRVLTQAAEALVDEFASLPPGIASTATVLAGVSGAALLLGAGWVKARRATADMLSELSQVGPGGERAARGLERTTKWAGRAAAAFVAFEVVSTAVHAVQEDLNPQIDAMAIGLERFGKGADLSGESARVLGEGLKDLAVGFKFIADTDDGNREVVRNFQGFLEALPLGLDGTSTSLTKTRERITAMDDALAQLVSGGKVSEAAASFGRLTAELAKDGVSIEEVKAQFPQYAAALEKAAVATDQAGGAAATANGQIKPLGPTAGEAAEAIDDLKKAFDELFGIQMGIDRATIAYREGLTTLREELHKGSRTLSINSTEGLKNRSAVLDQIDTIKDLREARIDHGMALDEADEKYRTDIAGLKKSMTQAGFTKRQIDGLVAAYEEIPGRVNTKVSSTGVPTVKTQLGGLIAMQQALKKGVAWKKPDESWLRGGFAEGGYTGPGGKYEAAGIVHKDEQVIKSESRRSLESARPGGLDYMNVTGRWPGYADGGRVIWPFHVTAKKARIPSKAEALAVVTPSFGTWPSSPGAQRGDSGVWRSVVRMIRATGPLSGEFGNGYRPGDPKWHGSGRAVDWMGYNQDALAQNLARRRPLELIHRTRNRDYAYTRGVNKGSFNNSLMEAHRNHIHIAMENGGTITEPVYGVGASGNTYSFGEGWKPERVTPNWQAGGGGSGGTTTIQVVFSGPVGSRWELENWLTGAVDNLKRKGKL